MAEEGFSDISAILGSGIYLLLLRGEIVYVGQSKLLYQRIYTHRYNSRSKNLPSFIPYRKMKFDAVQIMPCHVDKLNALEKFLIEKHQPRYNRRLLGPQPLIREPTELVVGKMRVVLNDPARNSIRRRILGPCSEQAA